MAKQYWFSFTPRPSDSANLSPTFINFAKFDGTTLTPPGITQPFTGTGFYQFTYTPTFSIAFLIDGATTGGGLTTAIRYIPGTLDPLDRVDELLAEQGSTLSALGNTSVALGTTNVALGTTNVAIGISNLAHGVSLLAYGASISAQGVSISAQGVSITAQGVSLFALGTTSVAIGTTLLGYASSLAFASSVLGSTSSSYGSSAADPVDLFGYLKRIREFLEGNQTFAKSTGSWNIYSRSSATLLITKSLTNSTSGVTRS